MPSMPELSTTYTVALSAFESGEHARAEELLSSILAQDPGYVPAHQLLARVYLRRGEAENARGILDRREELARDGDFWEWGGIAEELGLLDDAIGIYADHLARHADHGETLYRLGMLELDRDQREQARQHLLRAIQVSPGDVRAIKELAALYEEDGLLGLAEKLYGAALKAAPEDGDLRAAYELVKDRLARAGQMPDVEIPSDEAATRVMLALFSGRENVYARQWMDREGRIGYAPVYEPLTEAVLQRHLAGDVTAGVYPLRSDNTVFFAAIDVDINKAALGKSEENPKLRAHLEKLVWRDARCLKGMCDHLSVPCALESSGYKGCHVWFFLSEPILASEVRRFVAALMHRAGPASEDVHWELFPKQDAVEGGQIGNLIKLPLGIHRKTGKRGLFVDAEGRTCADQAACLAGIRRMDRDAFERAVAALAGGTEAAGAPLSLEELKERHPSLMNVWTECAVLRALAEKAYATHHLTNSERLVMTCVFAHLKDGAAFLHAVLRNSLDYSEKVTQYQIDRTRPNPISCPRIRHHLPELTASVNCACAFELPEGGYPSPVLRFEPSFTAGKARSRSRETEEVVQQYIQTRTSLRKARRKLEDAEHDLASLFDSWSADRVVTDAWVVHRLPDEGGFRVEMREDGERD